MNQSVKETQDTVPMRLWIISIGIVIVFSLGNYAADMSSYARHVWADAAWTLLSFIAALKCYRVASTLQSNLKRAWSFFGHACFSWFLGMLVWSYLELIQQVQTPFPAWSDLGFLAFSPLFMIGMIHLHAVLPGLSFTLLQLSKLGIIVFCIILIHLVVFQGPIQEMKDTPLYLYAALAYPVLYMSLFVQTLVFSGIYSKGRIRTVGLILALSVAVQSITNTFYSLALLGKEYAVGNLLDVFWIIGFVLIYVAAELQGNIHTGEKLLRQEARDSTPLLSLENFFSPMALVATLTVLYFYRENLAAVEDGYLYFAALVLIVFVSIRELTSKQIEVSLMNTVRESERELRSVLDNIQDTYFRIDLNERVVRVSPSVTDLLGFEVNDFLGSRLTDYCLDKDAIKRLYLALNSDTAKVSQYRLPLRHKNNAVVWVSVNAQSVKNADHNVIGVEGIARNITNLKRAEDVTRNNHEVLEERVRQRTAELEAARRTAEAASQAKTEFLSRMSHELRTPLNAILGFSQLLEMDPQLSNKHHKDNINEIIRSGFYLLDLINDVLDLAKIESGHVSVKCRPVELQPFLADCLSMVQSTADTRGIRLEGIEQIIQCKVLADEVRLRQVLINLMTNAIKYNRQGGVVRLKNELVGDKIHIHVTDTGSGIPKDKLDDLFVPFERLGAEQSSVPGTGIGLTIARHLVDLMGGALILASTSNEGSDFYIELPRADESFMCRPTGDQADAN